MTSTSFSKLRQYYQDIENERNYSVKLLNNEIKTLKQKAYVDHHVHKSCLKIQELSKKILQLKEEILNNVDTDPKNSFFMEFRKRKEFHDYITDKEKVLNRKIEANTTFEKNMNEISFDIRGTPHLNLFYDNMRYQEWMRQRKAAQKNKKRSKKHVLTIDNNDPSLAKFSGLENYGKYLDFSNLYNEFINNSFSQISFIEFVESIMKKEIFSLIPNNNQGNKFIDQLYEYIKGFIERSMPFFDLGSKLEQYKQMFSAEYKGDMEIRPYFCRYCNKQTLNEEEYQKHLGYASHKRNLKKGLEVKAKNDYNRNFHCFCIKQLFDDILDDKIKDTYENTERRSNLTSAVIIAEHEADAPIVFSESDSEDDAQFYNPKGLPLGWDGKPIPMWLYKLHGLSVEYKCEICGNRSYWGRASFDAHFFEQKHINSLRQLGIPATKHFNGITKISDATELLARIKEDLKKELWQKGMEEIETLDGGVMSKSMFDDLVRQGLLKNN